MPYYTPMPEPFIRSRGHDYDDENTFATPVRTIEPNYNAGTFTFGGQTLPLAERAPLAEAIERCFAADLGGPVDPNGYTVNGGAFAVVPVLNGAGDTLVSITVGAHSYTLGAASSLAASLREQTGTAQYDPDA